MRDIWSLLKERQRSAAGGAGEVSGRKGRVLRVKDGYNPNSSSVGSAIPAFLVFATASGAVTVLVLNLLGAVGGLLRKKKAEQPATPQGEGDDEASREQD